MDYEHGTEAIMTETENTKTRKMLTVAQYKQQGIYAAIRRKEVHAFVFHPPWH